VNQHTNEWSDEAVATLRTLRAAGHSYGQIAIRMGITKSAICGKAIRMALPEPAVRRTIKKPARVGQRFGSPWPSRDPELRRLWAEGNSQRIVANRMRLSRDAITKRAAWLGLPSRPATVEREAGAFALGAGVALPALPSTPKAKRPPVVPPAPPPVELSPPQPGLPPLRACAFPLWGDGVRPPKPPVFCGEPVSRRSYCERHAQVALVPVRQVSW
jgi:GcrA cell cycle regulator